MARIRSLKPEIHEDEAVGELSDPAFRLFVGLITQADDWGRLKGDPRLLSSQVWPYHPKTTEEIETWLAELDRADLIQRYAHAGRPFICLPSWAEHQRIDNAGRSKIPAPGDADGSSPDPAATRGDSPLEGRGGERSKERRGTSAIRTADAPLSHLLASLIEANGSKCRRVTRRWADAERLMLERDGRDAEEAERLIRWCQGSEFWRANVLSMPKFREQYDQLRLQAQRGNGSGLHAVDADVARLDEEKRRLEAEEAVA